MSKTRVMLLDHSLLDVMKMEKALLERGYDVLRMTSPNGVLAKIDYECPDVLLINPWMPRLDVAELLATLTSSEKFQDMVIVALGDKDAPTLQAFCIEHDLHGYFSKTMDIKSIGGFLDNFFEE